MKKAILYKKLRKGLIECQACAWHCKIPKGDTGICATRENQDGDLYLLVYGRPAAVNLDPMEKKPLFHFLPGRHIFSLGTVGCNLGCDFCQNWDIAQITRIIKEKYKSKKEASLKLRKICIENYEVWEPKTIIDHCLKNNIPAIAYTYNEPTIWFEYAYDTMKLAERKGIKNVFVSNGFLSIEAIKKLKSYLDAINIDLKSFNPDFYIKICKAKLEPVLEAIKRIYDAGIWLEITTLFIPGKNDSEDEMTKIARFIRDINPAIPWHVTAFHPEYKMLDVSPTPARTLEKAYEIGKREGLHFIYVGNIPDLERQSTHCPQCQTILIRRDYYSILENNIEKGRCPNCERKIEGVWK